MDAKLLSNCPTKRTLEQCCFIFGTNVNWQYQISRLFQSSCLDSGQCKSGCSMILSHQAINPNKQSTRKLNWTVANFDSRSIQSISWRQSHRGRCLECLLLADFSARLNVEILQVHLKQKQQPLKIKYNYFMHKTNLCLLKLHALSNFLFLIE